MSAQIPTSTSAHRPNRPPDAAPRDRTYSAYCMAPFFPSWLGNGTSRRACFIGGGVPGFPATSPGFCIGVALLDEVEDRNAALPARKGSRTVDGLAVGMVSSGATDRLGEAGTHLAGPLRPQTLLSTTWRRQRQRKGRWKEWRERGVEVAMGGGCRRVVRSKSSLGLALVSISLSNQPPSGWSRHPPRSTSPSQLNTIHEVVLHPDNLKPYFSLPGRRRGTPRDCRTCERLVPHFSVKMSGRVPSIACIGVIGRHVRSSSRAIISFSMLTNTS